MPVFNRLKRLTQPCSVALRVLLGAEFLRFVFLTTGTEFDAVIAGVEPDAVGIAAEASSFDFLKNSEGSDCSDTEAADTSREKVAAIGSRGIWM